jgi:hypothetical protein
MIATQTDITIRRAMFLFSVAIRHCVGSNSA